MFSHLIFDLDGTLTDSGLGILRSAQYALDHFGIHVEDINVLRPFVGPPLEDSFRNLYGMSREDALKAVEIYRVRYRKTGVYENEVYSGIHKALAALREKGYHLSIGTSKPIDMVNIVLDHFDLRRYFNLLGTRDIEGRLHTKSDVLKDLISRFDDNSNNPQSVTNRSLLMIGDRKYDVEGAHELGIPCMGVLWGYGDRKEMEECHADYIVGSVDEMLRILDV